MKNYLVKIRGGVEVDSAGKKAGKGPLIAEEISHTLGTSQDQYLFQAVEEKSKAIGFMRGLGGVQTMNEKMPTLQAANGMSGNNKPCVAYGVTTKGNGDAFVSEERHTSLSTGGGEAGQGYPCVMTAVGVDCYNIETTGEVAKTHTAGRNDKSNIPCVVTFEPGIASRDGGHVYEGVSGTLRATPGDNQMTVAFTTEMTPKVDTKGKAFSLRERDYKDPQAIVIENHPNDSRVRIDDSGTIQTLTSRCGTGGGNVPMVMQKVICLQGNGIDRTDTTGCNGKGWTEDVSYTLNTIDRPAVAYCMETFHCNTEEEKNPPIKARDYKDPLVICYEKAKK